MNSEEDRRILESYFPLIRFLAQQMPDTEFVLHDVSQLESSIIAIENNHISGRTVGGSATDLVLRIIQSREYESQDFTAVYKSMSENGRFLNSGTFFIKNGQRLIGILCLNTDLTPMHSLAKVVDDLFASRNQTEPNGAEYVQQFDEKLSSSVTDIPVETTLEIIREKNLSVQHLTQEERLTVIDELNRRGIFLLKGAIASVSRALQISEASTYRYLRQVKQTW
ncbi:MAG: helix-turn-helix transcriptional regulator [Spirochaetota bacterium]